LDKETEKWLTILVEKLKPEKIFVNIKDKIIGYCWNNKRKELRFLSQKEADQLSKKGMVWKQLGENWYAVLEAESRSQTERQKIREKQRKW